MPDPCHRPVRPRPRRPAPWVGRAARFGEALLTAALLAFLTACVAWSAASILHATASVAL